MYGVYLGNGFDVVYVTKLSGTKIMKHKYFEADIFVQVL